MKKLFLILILGLILRLVWLGDVPNGFSGDEAGQGYSAYSILNTGKDEWGQFLPLAFRSFGDFKPPLYTYLTVPSVWIFGLNEFAVRLPAAIIGVLTILIVYFLIKEWFGEDLAIISSLLLSINPWHIQLSRTAFEAGAGVLLFSTGLLFFLKALKREKNLIWTSFFWGLGLYSYHSFRVFIVIFAFIIFLFYKRKFSARKIFLSFLVFLIFSFPLVLNMGSTLTRASDVGLLSKDLVSGYFENKGTSTLPYFIDRTLDNKISFAANNLFGNYLSYFSFSFFFSGSRPDNSYLNFPGFPLLYPIEALFWIFAIFVVIKKEIPHKKILICWFIIASIPASLASGFLNAHRTVTFLPLAAIISGIGLLELRKVLPKLIKNQNLRIGVLSLALFFSFLNFLNFYLFRLPQKSPESIRVGYKQVFEKAIENEGNYKQIVISREFTQPQIYVAFYNKVDPKKVQEASKDWIRYEKSGKKFIDQLESWNLGKFYFEGLDWNNKDKLRKDALIVGKADEFPEDIKSVYDYKNSRGKILYRLVPVQND